MCGVRRFVIITVFISCSEKGLLTCYHCLFPHGSTSNRIRFESTQTTQPSLVFTHQFRNYSEGSGKSGKNGMTRKGVIERRQQFDPLLAQSRKVTADTAEHGHSLFGAETPGDLLLDFDHAQISLRLVVVKRDRKIEQEAQHGPLAPRKSIQQIASS